MAACLSVSCGDDPDLHASRVRTVDREVTVAGSTTGPAVDDVLVARYVEAVGWRQLERFVYAQALKMAAAVHQRQVTESRATPTTGRSAPEVGSGRCGGSLPPCWVMMRESRGDIRAENPTSSASGKWQFLDSTWAGFGGYARASHAPESVQDEKARQLWAGGSGCSHWSAC